MAEEENKISMNWKNLAKNKCPKCGKELDYMSDREMMMCTISCGFMCTSKRMSIIVGEMNKKKLDEFSHDNFAELQNFGREQNPFDEKEDDYSDEDY